MLHFVAPGAGPDRLLLNMLIKGKSLSGQEPGVKARQAANPRSEEFGKGFERYRGVAGQVIVRDALKRLRSFNEQKPDQ